MTLPLPANWTTGQQFTATAENNVETVVNNLGNGSIAVPANVSVSSAATLTMTAAYNVYVYTGASTTTWTLPAVSGNTGVRLQIENRASAAISLVAAGSDHIWYTSAVTSMTVAAGGSLALVNDGSYWNALSTDLVNNSVGALPVVNGGTGQNSLTSLALTTPTVTGYKETVYTATVASSATINLANGTVQVFTLTNATTCTFTMPTAVAGQSFVALCKQPTTTGTGLVTFTSALWPAAGTPTMTTGAYRADMYTFFSDGTYWYGSYIQGFTY